MDTAINCLFVLLGIGLVHGATTERDYGWILVVTCGAAILGLFAFFLINWRKNTKRGWWCNNCCDLHDGVCPRFLIGDCVECGYAVALDSAGLCKIGGRDHHVANRRAAIAAGVTSHQPTIEGESDGNPKEVPPER